MEKFYSICLILLLSFGFPFLSISQDVLFVTPYTEADITGSDKEIRDRLQSLGLTVHYKGSSGNLPVAADANGKDLVFISSAMYSGNVNTVFRDVAIPVIVSEAWLFDDMKMTGTTEEADYGDKEGQKLTILDPTHYIASQSNLTDKLEVYNSDEDFMWGVPSEDADLVARAKGTRYAIFVYEAGDNMVGMTAPALRIGFFIGPYAADDLTSNGWALFDNTINYSLQGSSACDDVEDGGKIAGNESDCQAYEADRVINVESASGPASTVEYRWVKSTSGPASLDNGTEIPNSNTEYYDPPTTTETTWYVRLAKGSDCSKFSYTSNAISKTVNNCNADGPELQAPKIAYSQCTLLPYVTGDHAFTMTLNGDKEDYIFDEEGGKVIYYDNGSAHITGMLVDVSSPTKKWYADVWFTNRRNWENWSGMGRSYKAGGDGSQKDSWDYYEMDHSRSSLVGREDYAGELLYLTHAPLNFTYGLQVGLGANDKNNENGMSAWFGVSSASGNYSGYGDINTVNTCESICTPSSSTTSAILSGYNSSSPGNGHHAVWLVTSGWSTNFHFTPEGGKLVTHEDGTAKITGNIYNGTHNSNQWALDIRLIHKRNWEAWSKLGRGYKNGGGTSNHKDWNYYEIDNQNSYLIGLGVNAGDTIFVKHDPPAYTYGIQIGYGANDKNSNLGLSGWLSFTGAKSGYGDLNLNITHLEEEYSPNASWVCNGSSWDTNTGFAFDFQTYQVGGINFNEFVFDDRGAQITSYFGNNAHVGGTIYHPSDPNLKWDVSLWFKNKKDWNAWYSDNGSYNFTGSNQATAEAHHAFWDFYELDPVRSIMVGRGTHQGDSLFLSQNSNTYTHGFQIGIGANGKTDAFGFSGWFDYTSHSGNFSGLANMNLSLECEEFCAPRPRVSSRVFLEGNYNGNTKTMTSQLKQADVIPLMNPYTASPWNYEFQDSVTEIPNTNIVDWVMVEARKKTDSTKSVNSKVGFLTTDGNIVDLDGKSYLELELGDNTDEYYFIISHRNHLSVMTNSPKAREGRVYFEDFTVSMDKAYINNSLSNPPMKVSSSGDLVMISGDANGNGGVNSVDLGMMVSQYFLAGYLMVDVTLNSVSNSVDLFRTVSNYFMLTHVPAKSK